MQTDARPRKHGRRPQEQGQHASAEGRASNWGDSAHRGHGHICGCHRVSWHRAGGSQGCHSALHSARDGRVGGDPRAGARVLGCRKVRPLAMVSVGAFRPKMNLKIVSKHVPLGLNLPEIQLQMWGRAPGSAFLGGTCPTRAWSVLGSRGQRRSCARVCSVPRPLWVPRALALHHPRSRSLRERGEGCAVRVPHGQGMAVSKRVQWAAVSQAPVCWLHAS